MSAFVMVSGSLFKRAEQRSSTSGRRFTVATLKVPAGNEVQWWRVTAFDDAMQPELLQLEKGASLSVQGPLEAKLYEKAGEKRISLGLVANAIFVLRQSARKQEKKSTSTTLDDGIPFREAS